MNNFVEVEQFLKELDNSPAFKKFVESHQKWDLPIYYQIEDGCLMVDPFDKFVYQFKSYELEKAMKKISIWTADVWNCGCSFTMGW